MIRTFHTHSLLMCLRCKTAKKQDLHLLSFMPLRTCFLEKNNAGKSCWTSPRMSIQQQSLCRVSGATSHLIWTKGEKPSGCLRRAEEAFAHGAGVHREASLNDPVQRVMEHQLVSELRILGRGSDGLAFRGNTSQESWHAECSANLSWISEQKASILFATITLRKQNSLYDLCE